MRLDKQTGLDGQAATKKGMSGLKKISILLIVIVAAGLITWGIASREEIVFGSTVVGTPSSTASSVAVKEKRPSVLGWGYDEKRNEAGEAMVFVAEIDSTTKIRQGWPYDSETYLSITLTGFKGQGSGVSIGLSSGEFDCPLEECFITVGFDGKPANQYRFVGAGSGDGSIKFLPLPRERFISDLKASNTAVLTAKLAGYGEAQFEFDTSGLAWVY